MSDIGPGRVDVANDGYALDVPKEQMANAPRSQIHFATPALERGFHKLKREKAREFAVTAHAEQRYGDEPYVTHLEAVVRVLEDFAFENDYLIAGWLHDVLEDTDKTFADIEAEFGNWVANVVWAVSGSGERAEHVASIHQKIAALPEAAAVKLADRIANVEACKAGDKHAARYHREHVEFAKVIEPHVPAEMWQRYLDA